MALPSPRECGLMGLPSEANSWQQRESATGDYTRETKGMFFSIRGFILPGEAMPRTKNGILEYWNIGVLEYWSIGRCQFQVFHHSTTPPIRRPVQNLTHLQQLPVFKDSSVGALAGGPG